METEIRSYRVVGKQVNRRVSSTAKFCSGCKEEETGLTDVDRALKRFHLKLTKLQSDYEIFHRLLFESHSTKALW